MIKALLLYVVIPLALLPLGLVAVLLFYIAAILLDYLSNKGN